VQAAEPQDEIAGLPLPLLARAAGHWKARTDHHHLKELAPAVAGNDMPLLPLEELLGRGEGCLTYGSASILSLPPLCHTEMTGHQD